MVFSPQRFDRMEIELLVYHYPKPSYGEGGAMTLEAQTIDLQTVVRDLGLKGREAMVQRAYSRFCKEGLMVRSGFGYRITQKGIDLVKQYKKLYSSM